MTHEIGLQTKVQGFFSLVKRDATTGKVKQVIGPFKNMITNLGLNRLGSGGVIDVCYVGTGTNPATAGDTNMGAFKTMTLTVDKAEQAPVSPTWFAQRTFTFKFGAGTINGNITEVGVGWSTNPNNALWSRELIVDGSGKPVTLTVLANENLDVIYTVRYYMNVNDVAGSFTLNSTVYNYTLRPALAGSTSIIEGNAMGSPGVSRAYGSDAALGAITGTMSGTPLSAGAVTSSGYVNNSYTREAVTAWNTGQGNSVNGIKGFDIRTNISSSFLNAYYQMLLDKVIPKTKLNTMSISFKYSWSRYTGPIL